MSHAIKTEALTKRFGRFTAVDSIDIHVNERDIYGFLGLNGAGKTTTIRMILGLIKPTSGNTYINGIDATRNHKQVLKDVGSLVELPAYYGYLSARNNLELLRLISKNTDKSSIDDALEMVGLSNQADQRVGTFSQGMKQRLAIAMALLSKPGLVILDEPTNGLDPEGTKLVRDVVLNMNKTNGTTFFISSHLLHEVELTCNRVGIIKQGKLIIEDEVKNLIGMTTKYLRIVAEPIDKAIEIIRSIDTVSNVETLDDHLNVRVAGHDYSRINDDLVKSGVKVSEFTPVKMTLEEFFLARQ